MIDELLERLPGLTGAELSRLEAAARRELELRSRGAGGGEDEGPEERGPGDDGYGPQRTEVLEYRPHLDGHLQLELRRYVRKDGSTKERGPYWYFHHHEDGKRKKLYLGKCDKATPEEVLAHKRARNLP